MKEKGDLEEYNAFDIYGSINEYDRYSGITSGKNVKDYICANNDKLTKKYVRSSFKKPDINNVMTYLQTLTFPDYDPENGGISKDGIL